MPEGNKVELFFWWFQVSGAFFGMISLIWQIVTQFVGSYDSQTIRKVLSDQSKEIKDFSRRFADLAEQIAKMKKGER